MHLTHSEFQIISAKTPHCVEQSEHSSSPLSIFAGGWHQLAAASMLENCSSWPMCCCGRSSCRHSPSSLIGRLCPKWPKDVPKKCRVQGAAFRAPVFVGDKGVKPCRTRSTVIDWRIWRGQHCPCFSTGCPGSVVKAQIISNSYLQDVKGIRLRHKKPLISCHVLLSSPPTC